MNNKKPKIESVKINQNSGSILFDYNSFFGTFDFIYLKQDRWIEGIDLMFEKGSMHISLPPAFLKNQPSIVNLFHLCCQLVPYAAKC